MIRNIQRKAENKSCMPAPAFMHYRCLFCGSKFMLNTLPSKQLSVCRHQWRCHEKLFKYCFSLHSSRQNTGTVSRLGKTPALSQTSDWEGEMISTGLRLLGAGTIHARIHTQAPLQHHHQSQGTVLTVHEMGDNPNIVTCPDNKGQGPVAEQREGQWLLPKVLRFPSPTAPQPQTLGSTQYRSKECRQMPSSASVI